MKVVIHAGKSWQKWSPHIDDFESHFGLGGSQLAATRVAHSLASASKANHVVLVGDFTEDALVKNCCRTNLVFKPLAQYEIELFKENVDLLVVSRYTEYLRSFPTIKNIVLWCHDVEPIGPLPQLTNTFFYSLFALSDWHQQHLANRFPFLNTIQTKNGLEKSLFAGEPWSHKVKNRFIYSSAVYRGLDVVLRCWPRILALLPYATLHIYTDFASPLVLKTMREEAQNLEKKCLSMSSITCFGFVGQKQLRDAFYEADVWFYPTEFEETYCITALEAQASGTLCCYAPVAALCQTVGKDKGIELPSKKSFLNETDYEKAIVGEVYNALHGKGRENGLEIRKRARTWALAQTWDSVAKDWIKEFI